MDQNFSGLPARFTNKYVRTSFPGDKLTGNFGNELGNKSIGDRSEFCFLTKKLALNNFGLFSTVSSISTDSALQRHVCFTPPTTDIEADIANVVEVP